MMGDVIKWGLLVAGIVLLISMIAGLPFLEFMNLDEFTGAIASVVEICAGAFKFGRGVINLFFTEFGRKAVTGLIVWVIIKPFSMQAIQYIVMVYHYIFK